MEFYLAASVATIILIALLVGVHEYGHLIVAKKLGVKVLRFSIGFGKRIFCFTSKSNIEYCISLLPLGGYVKMLDTREAKVDPKEAYLAYDKQVLWKQFLIILAGPLFNLIFALVSLWIIFSVGYKAIVPIIPKLEPNSVLVQAGVKSGMEITSIDGYPILDWADVTVRLFQRLGTDADFPLTVKSAQGEQTFTINLGKSKVDPLNPDPIKIAGIVIEKKKIKEYPERIYQYQALDALGAAYNKMAMYSYFCIVAIKNLFTGTLSVKSLTGPIGLFAYAGMAFLDGLMTFLLFMAILSIIIAIVNLIPFPGLDGGHLLYIFIEVIFRQPITVAMQVLLFRLGLIMLGILFVQVIANDLTRFAS